MLRSIGAVVLGFLVIGALAGGTTAALPSIVPTLFGPGGRVDSVGLMLAMQAYVVVFATFGCWLAARLAPSRPMAHALVLGLLGLAFNAYGSAAQWNVYPAWYHALGLGLTMPAAWLGGWLRERQLARAVPAGGLAAA